MSRVLKYAATVGGWTDSSSGNVKSPDVTTRPKNLWLTDSPGLYRHDFNVLFSFDGKHGCTNTWLNRNVNPFTAVTSPETDQ